MSFLLQKTLEKAKEGSKTAKEELLNRLQPMINAAVNRNWGDDKEDLYQEACIAVLECIKDYDPGRGVPFLLYVKKMLNFRLFNITRRRRHIISLDQRLSVDDGEGSTFGDLLPSGEPNIQDIIIQKEDIKELYAAIQQLTPKQRQVILMHFFEGIKYKDIAQKRGKHYKSVLRLKDRALSSLKERMADKQGVLF